MSAFSAARASFRSRVLKQCSVGSHLSLNSMRKSPHVLRRLLRYSIIYRRLVMGCHLFFLWQASSVAFRRTPSFLGLRLPLQARLQPKTVPLWHFICRPGVVFISPWRLYIAVFIFALHIVRSSQQGLRKSCTLAFVSGAAPRKSYRETVAAYSTYVYPFKRRYQRTF